MDYQSQGKRLATAIRVRNISISVAGVSLLINLLLAVVLVAQDTHVVVVPSAISQRLELTKQQVSSSYLDAMSRDVMTTLLNVTPESIEAAHQSILTMVYPKAYGQVKQQLYQQQQDIKKRQWVTAFYPVLIQSDPKTLTSHIEGDVHTYIGRKGLHKERRRFVLHYHYASGRLTVQDLKEVKEGEHAALH